MNDYINDFNYDKSTTINLPPNKKGEDVFISRDEVRELKITELGIYTSISHHFDDENYTVETFKEINDNGITKWCNMKYSNVKIDLNNMNFDILSDKNGNLFELIMFKDTFKDKMRRLAKWILNNKSLIK